MSTHEQPALIPREDNMIYVYGQKDCAPCTLLTKKLNREGVPH